MASKKGYGVSRSLKLSSYGHIRWIVSIFKNLNISILLHSSVLFCRYRYYFVDIYFVPNKSFRLPVARNCFSSSAG